MSESENYAGLHQDVSVNHLHVIKLQSVLLIDGLIIMNHNSVKENSYNMTGAFKVETIMVDANSFPKRQKSRV